MITLSLIGIGTGNPQHLTRQAEAAMQSLDLILIPNKGAGKDDLAGLRRAICTNVLGDAATAKIVEFDLPVRDPAVADYHQRVEDWHDAIASVWARTIDAHLPEGGRVGFLVWGDPSLYDSTMRIANRLQAQRDLDLQIIPGVTSIQALTAAHAIPLNDIGAPVTITTGRRLRNEGWPKGVDTVVVMLDGQCSFQCLLEQPENGDTTEIYWTAYAGMDNEISRQGLLHEVAQDIISTRADARAAHGWIMDIYLLRRS